ncbi:unnamed protein product [Sphagnum troendelagicum]|uniref:RING-type domain-containing protein n=1 Tax=Sphagnum troendelagicum TaxID=128251 RepID=A0ABP0T8N0_9BRYO
MGRSSGGYVEQGSGMHASSQAGASGAYEHSYPQLDPSATAPPPALSSYYDSYRPGRSRTQDLQWHEFLQFGNRFFTIAIFITAFASAWMLLSLYSSQQIEMGLNYSRLVTTNSIFVKEMQVLNLGATGPVFYYFSKPPVYDHPIIWKEEHENVAIEAFDNEQFKFWLNKGSSFKISYDMTMGHGKDSLILAIVKGEDGFLEWKSDPSNPNSALKWKRFRDDGSMSFEVDEDNEYFIVFGNLNSHRLEVSFQLKMHFVLYSKEGAESLCSTVLADICPFPVTFLEKGYLLLSSPIVEQWGVNVWSVKVLYVPRWLMYFLLWGFVVLGFVITKAMIKYFEGRLHYPVDVEQGPLIAPQTVPSSKATNSSQDLAPSAPPAQYYENLPEDQLCTICLDAPKDSFMDPCGHRCTCYACGMRIQNEDSPKCPICRQSVHMVRRIFDS